MFHPPPALPMDRAAAKLFEISVSLSEPVQLNQVLQRVRSAIIEGLGFDRCGIFVLDEVAGVLRGTWGTDEHGELDDISQQLHFLSDTSRRIVQVALGHVPYFLTDDLEALARAEGLPHFARMRGVHAHACIPLRARGRVVGVLGVDNLLTDRPIPAAGLEVLAPFAAQAAIAIDNALLLERLDAREREQQRLYDLVETERQRLEAAFAQAQARLVDATRLAAIGEMAATIAHELRDPLNVLDANRHLLDHLVGGRNPKADASLARMAEYLSRASQIINDLLAFARDGRTNPQPISAGLLLREVLDEFTLPPGIAAAIAPTDPMLTLEADALQLYQALRNLVLNAIQAMPEGGTLTLAASLSDAGSPGTRGAAGSGTTQEPNTPHPPPETSGSGIEFTVGDTGIGMVPEQIARACDPLFTTKERGTGLGLGLALVLRIVEAHGGFLAFESEPGRGTTVRLWLPACR